MKRYDPSTEQTLKRFYATLSEKDRRRYAGVEALKLGHGGINYISQLLGCDRNTVAQGIEEVTGFFVKLFSLDKNKRACRQIVSRKIG